MFTQRHQLTFWRFESFFDVGTVAIEEQHTEMIIIAPTNNCVFSPIFQRHMEYEFGRHEHWAINGDAGATIAQIFNLAIEDAFLIWQFYLSAQQGGQTGNLSTFLTNNSYCIFSDSGHAIVIITRKF